MKSSFGQKLRSKLRHPTPGRVAQLRLRWRAWLAIVLCMVVAAGLWSLLPHSAQAPRQQVTNGNSERVSPAPQLDPLQIEAIRSRTYTASKLVTERELGDQGGYSLAVARYDSDNLKQFALVATPAGASPAGGWPTVILAHGYIDPAAYRTDGGDYGGIIAALARAGFLVVKPDYRGHGLSEGTASGGHFSPVYTYDVISLIETLKAGGVANPKRIGLLGHSLGGHVVLRTAVVNQDVRATAIMAGVVGSFEDIVFNWPRSPVARDRPAPAVQGTRTALLAKYGDPRTNPAFWSSASAINYVSSIEGAVQIHQSEGDSTVPRLFSDHLNTALLGAKKSPEYYLYPGDDHQFSFQGSAVIDRLIAFYRAHL